MTQSLRQRAMAGESIVGSMVFECFSANIAQILKMAGCEFAIFDMEHTGLGFETVKMLCATCRGIGVVPMARVPRGEYHFLARTLDIGAHGVMVPMVESAEEARAIVEATHYPPRGRRGAAFGFAHDNFEPGDVKKKIEALDRRNLVIAQIETERGLENVEAIAAIEGIDVLWIGHFDLTNFLSIPAQFEHPKYLAAIDRVIAAAKAHHKGLGVMAADPAWAVRYRALGFNMIAAGTEPSILIAGIKTILSPVMPKT